MHCKAFEDNSGAIDLACLPKIRPRTKHINVMFHNFREYVRKGLIHIQQVSMYYQCAGAWTRPFPHNVFLKQHKIIYYSHLSV